MKIELEVSQEKINDLLIAALEGGSNYWYFLDDEAVDIIHANQPAGNPEDVIVPMSVQLCKAIEAGARIPINDIEDTDNVLGYLSKEGIEHSLGIMADSQPEHILNLLSEDNWDATTADVFFQYAVMGEIVFG